MLRVGNSQRLVSFQVSQQKLSLLKPKVGKNTEMTHSSSGSKWANLVPYHHQRFVNIQKRQIVSYRRQPSLSLPVLRRFSSVVRSQKKLLALEKSFLHIRHNSSSSGGRSFSPKIPPAYLKALAAFLVGCGVYYVGSYRYRKTVPEAVRESDVTLGVKVDDDDGCKRKSLSLQEAIAQATDLCERVKDESGSPGLVVAVSVDGKLAWSRGFGYADVENRVPCMPNTVMRIASISKSFTMTAVAKAMESGDLDLDKTVQAYVPDFPKKSFDGEEVDITTRQLVSHLAGIRHYERDYINEGKDKAKSSESSTDSQQSNKKEKDDSKATESDKKSSKGLKVSKEFQNEEYYIKDKMDTTEESLAIFKDDPLVHKPGTKYLYTTHGWTLVAAVLEGATKKKFPDLMRDLFRDLGLENTFLDENQPLIYNRSSYYVRTDKNKLVNAPFVDCSYKFAGGGILSTVTDLLQFGNAMLYSYQWPGNVTGRPVIGNNNKLGSEGENSGSGKDRTASGSISCENSKSDKDRMLGSGGGGGFSEKAKSSGNDSKDLSEKNSSSQAIDEKTNVDSSAGNSVNQKASAKDSESQKASENTSKIQKASAKNSESQNTSAKNSANHKPTLLPGFLKPETVEKIWKPVELSPCDWDKDGFYAMGWAVVPEKNAGFSKHSRFYISHTGGAVGCSSVLLILPREELGKGGNCLPSPSSNRKDFGKGGNVDLPKGVTVAVMVNMISVSLSKTALKIAKLFEEISLE